MSWADLVLLVILASFTITGAYRGLMRQLIEALGLVLSLVTAVGFYLPLARVLRDVWRVALASEPLAFAVLLLGVWSATRLAGILVAGKASRSQHARSDVLGGAVLGLVTGFVLLAGVIIGLDLVGAPVGTQLATSLVGGWLLGLAQGIITTLPGL
jgi:uncharacterized membrane protein required for colicin V production